MKRILSSCVIALVLCAGASSFTPSAFGCGSTSGPSTCKGTSEQSSPSLFPSFDDVVAWFGALVGG